jgi:hypothetical protein
MNLPIVPYRRFWYGLGHEIPLDENGLLRNPESKWFHVYFVGEIFTIEKLTTLECILLLGEPGIGKSTELRNLKEHEAVKKYYSTTFNLRDFESKSDFKESVLDDDVISKWMQNSDKPISIYLDSLDEALLEAKKISVGIFNVIRELQKYGQVFTRIACRTSELPTEFQEQLSSLYQENSLKAVELAPLRDLDVKLAARENGVEDDVFYKVILEKDLGVLASRPITLNMLIQEFVERGEISDNIDDIYEKGCLFLLEDSDYRKEAGYTGELTPSQRLIVAERIAAVLMLCNKSNVNVGSIKYVVNTDIYIDQIDTGKEYNPHSLDVLFVSKQIIQETVQTSLFKSGGNDRFSLIHQTFAEFLAAKYLVRNQFTISQLKSILLHEDGTSRGVIPQLKEVAMWLSLLHDEFYMELIEIDPFLLLKSNISIDDPKKHEFLTKSLIKHVSERKKDPFYRQHSKYLKHLEYIGIDELLKEELLKSDADSYTKSFIMEIISAIELKTMADALISLASKESENLKLRENALEAVSDLNNVTDNEKLLSLLKAEGDEFNRLKAKAVKCLYPDTISSEKVIELLNRSENLKKEILKLSGYHILESSSNKDVENFLDWAADNIPQNGFPDYDTSYFFDEIILEAINKTDEKAILLKLAKLIFEKIRKRYSVFNSTSSERSYKKFLSYTDKRRKIAEKIVLIFTDHEDLGYKLRRYQQNLVTEDDFGWVLNHILTAKNERTGRIWAEILRWSFNPDNVGQIDKILSNQNNGSIQKSFKYWLTPVDIQSEEGKKARKEYEEAWSNKSKKRTKEISPQQIIRLRLKELREGDIDAFGDLDVALSLKPESRTYHKRLDFNVEQYPGWIAADDSIREEILNHAVNFLYESKPEEEDWIYDFRSRSAYRALRLISIYRPADYDSIPDKVWGKWLKPFVYFELSDGINASQNFLKVFYQKFPKEVIDFIIVLIKLENKKYEGTVFETQNIDSILKDDLANAFYSLLDDDELKPKTKEMIKEKLLEIGHKKVLEYIKSNLEKKNEDELTRDAYLISKYSPDVFFQMFWPEFEANSDLSHKIITKVAFAERHQQEILQSLNEEQLAKLYVWLEKNYPAYVYTEGMVIVTDEMRISDFRRYTLKNLVARGTEEACYQMFNVVAAFPDQQWLKIRYEETKEIYRRENWQPLKVNELLFATNEKEDSPQEEEIIELRPNIFGFGINLRALWRKFF